MRYGATHRGFKSRPLRHPLAQSPNDDLARPCGRAPAGAGPPDPAPGPSARGRRSSAPAAAAASAFGRPAESRIIASMFDVIIEGGDLVDGTGAAPRRADVGIAGGDITAIDDLAAAEAEAADRRDRPHRRARLHRHPHPHRGRPPRRPPARDGPVPGDHHRDLRPRRPLVRAALPRQLPVEPALSRGPARLAARGTRHIHRRRLPAARTTARSPSTRPTSPLTGRSGSRRSASATRRSSATRSTTPAASSANRSRTEQSASRAASTTTPTPGATRRSSSSSRRRPATRAAST